MNRFVVLILFFGLSATLQAAWYWPFRGLGSGSGEPRLSELMEPATDLIDEASDLAAEGKSQEAVEKYREALLAIDRIEEENPGRAENPEFATIRNKRAYVNAAIDALLLAQIKDNARAVAVSDTTALEKRLSEERAKEKSKEKKKDQTTAKSEKKELRRPSETNSVEKAEVQSVPSPKQTKSKARALTPRERVMVDLSRKDYAAASLLIEEMLVEKPNDATALNLRAATEAAQGNLKAAETALDQAIMSNPRNYFAYYNMARLKLQLTPPDRSAARRYYETGRTVGGPVDTGLEERVK